VLPRVLLIIMSFSGGGSNSDESYGPLSVEVIAPALSHRIYVLIGFAWPAYGFLFLNMLCSNGWFALGFSIVWLFPLICLIALLLGHATAIALESRWMTSGLYYFRRGMPLLFYRRFALVQATASGAGADALDRGHHAIIFGAKRILLSAADELHLTFLGALEIRSYAASGKVMAAVAKDSDAPLNKADLLARVPIGALTLSDQKRLVEIFRAGRPGLTVNKRLDDRLNSPIVKGQALISSLGAIILLYALFDVSYATFTWLEMLKDYYGSQLCLSHPEKAQLFLGAAGAKQPKEIALDLYDRAEQLRTHPFALSWAYRALFTNGNSAADLLSIRAETLYRFGRKDEAIAVLQEALRSKPSGYKVQLQLARMLAEGGNRDQARQILEKVLEKHKDLLLPRVYNYALIARDAKAADALYKKYLAELDDQVFGEEPGWPPTVEKPLMEMWRRDDLEFLVHLLAPSDKK
jgi:tetratricopeptide (TPR) repeat protein